MNIPGVKIVNESRKTGIFAAVAALMALAAWWTSPRVSFKENFAESVVNKEIFDKYDPSAAASLKIVKYDDALAKFKTFEVSRSRDGGAWTIPSHDGYPADASKQMSEAANLFLGMIAIGLQSTNREDQKLYGVVEPDQERIEIGAEGVGTLVRLQDARGDTLVNLVIGKEVKDDPKLRFVRKPNEDAIYVAAVDTSVLSTDFKRWIEDDLLKLSSTDIDTINFRDYSVLQGVEQGRLTASLAYSFDADVKFNLSDGKWSLLDMIVYQDNQPNARTLGENEQLNETKLNEVKNTLDSLRINNVKRKPAGLAANLKAEKSLLDDNQSVISLFNRGFVPQVSEKDGSTEIFASSGEITVSLKDGVQYLLRFGNKDTSGGSSDSSESGKGNEMALDRYLLVTCKLDESRFPPPNLKALPETIEDMLRMEAFERAAATPPTTSSDVIEIGSDSNDNQEDDGSSNDAPESAAETNLETSDSSLPTLETPADTSEKVIEGGSGDGDGGREQARVSGRRTYLVSTQPPESESSEAPSEQQPEAASEQSQDQPPAQESEEELKERLEATREKITRDNQRAIDDRNEKISSARRKVDELNARFAEWYYLISESEYKKLRVTLDDLIQPKGAASANSSRLTPPDVSFPDQP